MKKVFIALILIIIFMLCSCDFQGQINKNKQQLYELSIVDSDIQAVLLSREGMGDQPMPRTMIDFYRDFNNYDNISLYEAYLNYNETTYLGIYMDNKTIKKLDNIYKDDVLPDMLDSYTIRGIDGMLLKYQYAYYEKLIDANQYSLFFYEFIDQKIPLMNGNYRLVAVLTRNEMEFQNINGKDIYKSNMFSVINGSITEDYYLVSASKLESAEELFYLYCNNRVPQYCFPSYKKLVFYPVKPYNSKKSICEQYSKFSDKSYELISEQYYEFIKDAIIEEKYQDNYVNHCYICDYDIIKQLLLREYYN